MTQEIPRFLSYPDSEDYFQEQISNRLEITHLTIATLVIFIVTLFLEIPLILSSLSNPPLLTVVVTIGALITVTSFVGRYLAQKYTALKMQIGVRFRIVVITTILTLVSAFLPLAVVSPGVMIPEDPITVFEEARIKLPGPLINLILGLISFGLWLNLGMIDPSASFLALLSLRLNIFIGLTSMIPVGLFDGQAIYDWDRRVWITIALCFVAFYLGSIFL
ncbi:MAG: hypothetical protein ACW976_07695 [Candidatus Ranarchaeia archaeon]|jgi:hypothetical protein